MNLNNAIDAIEDEIDWHKKNNPKCAELSKDYKKGFIKGLQQARLLITKLRDGDFIEVSGSRHNGNGI